MGKKKHVVHNSKKCAVKGAGNEKTQELWILKKEAVEKAREMARNQQTELIIHRTDGRIRDKDNYGRDPHSIKS